MASIYLDTSALLKLYIAEEGTERVVSVAEEATAGRIVILDLTPVGSSPARA